MRVPSFLAFLACVLVFQFGAPARTFADDSEPFPIAPKELTADHSRFDALKKPFKSGDEVTEACLTCHNEADAQLRATHHWSWHVAGDPSVGKGGLTVNNFCISPNKMGDESCLDCHIGWNGQKGQVNCLVCHSQKEMKWKEAFADLEAFKTDPDAQEIVDDINAELTESITAIGPPALSNCGYCHFWSGGGDGVKRGDLDTSLLSAESDLDVHMASTELGGAGMSCIDCHNTRNHHVPGRQYSVSAKARRQELHEPEYRSFLKCQSCHSEAPHHNQKLNDHFEFLACQTCHIPKIARKNPTKVWWDWSKAGKTKDGKPYHTKDKYGKHDYLSIKGEFRWEKNIVPAYDWYNGTMKGLRLDEEVSPGNEGVDVPVQIPNGEPFDGQSKINPFKVHRGKQPYDPENHRLLAPMLSGKDGFWTTLDWELALKAGMDAAELPYSGSHTFVTSKFLYPIHHTVAPKKKALKCEDCHRSVGSRMAGVKGVYVPGRGELQTLTFYTWIGIGLILIGAVCHALTRLLLKIRKSLKRDRANG